MRVILSLCCLILSVVGFAQKFSFEYNSVKFFCKVKDGNVWITGFDRNASIVTIPGEITYDGKDYKITKIDTYRSGDTYNTTSITIEHGIQEIANYCFVEFRHLTDVNLPHSIIKIGKNSFTNKEKLNIIASKHVLTSIYGRNIPKHITLNNKPNNNIATSNYPTNNNQKSSSYQLTKNEQKRATKSADIDIDIPSTGKVNEKSFAVIIANENYDVETPVDFAINDGTLFKLYCKNIFGVPEENIRYVENATHMQIKRTMSWLKKVTDLHKNNCKVYFYYAGHGMPDESNGNGYILPTDGYASDIAVSGYKLSELYEQLGNLSANIVTVFLDACFSGMKRDGSAVLAARAVAIAPDEEDISGNVIVFSATSDSETAYSYEQVGHGLFSYYLMKKLKETSGSVSYGELARYISTEVGRKSITINDKTQTPQVQVAPSFEDSWKSLSF